MLPLQKNKKINQADQIDNLLLPVTGMVFSKKPISKENPEKNSIDFHLEIINKIDKLLKEHGGESFSLDSITGQQKCNSPEERPIEIRDPLSKKIGLSVVKPGIKPDDIFTNRETKPEDFKTDISAANDLGFMEDILLMKETENKRIEIIDLDSLSVGDATTQKISSLFLDETRGVKHQTGNSLKNKLDPDKILGKKVEVIDAKELGNKKFDKVFSKAEQQPKENERRAQVYYIDGSRHQKENRFKESESERLHAPENFRDKLKELEEAEEELKRKKKELEEQEKEAEKLKELEAKKAIIEAKEKEKATKKAKRENEATIKRQEKEQRKKEREEEKLKRLELKKAAMEEKKKKIEAKKAEKEKERELREKAVEEKKLKELELKKAMMEAKEKERAVIKTEEEKKEKLKRQDIELREKQREEQRLKSIETKNALIETRKKDKEAKIAEKEKEKKALLATKEREEDEEKILEIDDKKKKDKKPEPTLLDEDVKKLLAITDNLLGELPEEVIDKFAQSKDFELYSKILNKYKIK